MAKRDLPPPEFLRQLLDYNAETGEFIWRARSPEMFAESAEGTIRSPEWYCRRWNTRFAGKQAFGWLSNGYRSGTIFCKRLYAHRTAWAMHTGEWPPRDLDIDHINGDKTDNRIANLRLVTRSTNLRNSSRPAHNTSGHVGVRFHKGMNKWHAYIAIRGGPIELGYYATKGEAIAARRKANAEHGFTARHGAG